MSAPICNRLSPAGGALLDPGGAVGCPVSVEVHVKRLVRFMREGVGVFELRALSFFFPNSKLYYFPNGRSSSTERKTWQVYSFGKINVLRFD